MKKFLFFLGLAWAFSACDKAVEPPVVNNPNIPDAVVQAILKNFDNVSDLKFETLKANELYAADFKSQQIHHDAVLDRDGNIKELNAESATLTLPDAAQAYLDAEYPGAKLNAVLELYAPQTKDLIGYAADITSAAGDHLLVNFDLLGALTGVVGLPAQNQDEWSKYVVDNYQDLPANIRAFLENNHPGLVFDAGTVVLLNGQVERYVVSVKQGDTTYYYELGPDSNVLSTYAFSPSSPGGNDPNFTYGPFTDPKEVPQVVSDYLNSHFPGWQFLKGLKKADDTGTLVEYLIVAQLGPDIYYFTFNGKGVFTGAWIG